MTFFGVATGGAVVIVFPNSSAMCPAILLRSIKFLPAEYILRVLEVLPCFPLILC